MCDITHRPPTGSRCVYSEKAVSTATKQGAYIDKWREFIDHLKMEKDNKPYLQVEMDTTFSEEPQPAWVSELIRINTQQSKFMESQAKAFGEQCSNGQTHVNFS